MTSIHTWQNVHCPPGIPTLPFFLEGTGSTKFISIELIAIIKYAMQLFSLRNSFQILDMLQHIEKH